MSTKSLHQPHFRSHPLPMTNKPSTDLGKDFSSKVNTKHFSMLFSFWPQELFPVNFYHISDCLIPESTQEDFACRVLSKILRGDHSHEFSGNLSFISDPCWLFQILRWLIKSRRVGFSLHPKV